ncbi:MAG: hypothetical protein DRQ10_04950 [Candidatus Hydrothermota bacterium]|nr:MAG: hypothetical protein DRQ10_04950 [Candidatus Hydrothermae bacterium]
MIKFYRVTPHSVLFFRDPRPFTAGEQALARLQFPPRLAPFLGAIRTKYLEEKAGGKPISALFPYIEDDLKQISIFWFSLLKNGTSLIPAPCDLITSWKKLDESRFVTERLEVNGKFENPKVPLLSPHKAELFESAHYLTPQGFAKYQNGELPSKGEYFSLDDLWEFENRVGIGLSYETKTTERSKFYRITVARPKKDVGFLVGVEFGDSIELPEIFDTTFTTRLGGEGHIAVWEKVNDAKLTNGSPHFSEVVALTHVPIKSNKQGSEYGFEIQNWCINKLDAVGGWDYKERRPKHLVRALEPGAVLIVQKGNALPSETYGIKFGNHGSITIVKNLVISINGNKPYLVDSRPKLGDPDILLVIKN